MLVAAALAVGVGWAALLLSSGDYRHSAADWAGVVGASLIAGVLASGLLLLCLVAAKFVTAPSRLWARQEARLQRIKAERDEARGALASRRQLSADERRRLEKIKVLAGKLNEWLSGRSIVLKESAQIERWIEELDEERSALAEYENVRIMAHFFVLEVTVLFHQVKSSPTSHDFIRDHQRSIDGMYQLLIRSANAMLRGE